LVGPSKREGDEDGAKAAQTDMCVRWAKRRKRAKLMGEEVSEEKGDVAGGAVMGDR
jgi:hypothetical protein